MQKIVKFMWILALAIICYGSAYADQICEIPPLETSPVARIEGRSFPSIIQAWDHLIGSTQEFDTFGYIYDEPLHTERITKHDLYFSPPFALWWNIMPTELPYGLTTRLGGNLEKSIAMHQQRLHLNPNLLFLLEVRIHNHFRLDAYPPDSDFWIKDSEGQFIKNDVGWDEYLIDIFNPTVQEILINRIVGVAECGLYDGVMLDGFNRHGAPYYSRHLKIATEEEAIAAHAQILKGVRERVRDDFLILVNANDTKIPRYTEYVNGSFMEVGYDDQDGYSYQRLQKIEDVLLWNEKNLRYPRINSLRADGFGQYPPEAPENRRWMRLFTTMNLTHSDGYVLYTTGRAELSNRTSPMPHHEHIWYNFWNADLGHPIGAKGKLYDSRDGLFIREFDNGWAVYNRSGKAQTISLPVKTTGVSSGQWTTEHILPDLDGEIYLKSVVTEDVNADGVVNVLDLVIVANAFGKAEPDMNADGVVNVLDLVRVANAF